MTTDPSTNYALKKYGLPLSSDPLVLYYQNAQIVELFKYCAGMKMDKKVLKSYFQKNSAANFTKKQRFDAHFIVSSKFNDFAYQDLAGLCAGAPYLYGKDGVLVPKALLKAGKGYPSEPMNPMGPYFKVTIPE